MLRNTVTKHHFLGVPPLGVHPGSVLLQKQERNQRVKCAIWDCEWIGDEADLVEVSDPTPDGDHRSVASVCLVHGRELVEEFGWDWSNEYPL